MVLTNRFSGRGEGWEESYRFTKKGFYVGIRKTLLLVCIVPSWVRTLIRISHSLIITRD